MRRAAVIDRMYIYALAIAVTGILSMVVHAQSPIETLTHSTLAQELSASFRSAVKTAQPSIVFIEAQKGPRTLMELSPHDFRGSEGSIAPPPNADAAERVGDDPRDTSGTGVVIDARGYVLTCNHLVKGAHAVFVRLPDGARKEAVRVLADPLTDVAIVQVSDFGPLAPAKLADSDELRAGDWVVSIGNPYGLGLSVSAGIVSGVDRFSPFAPRTTLIQTDAASNPGNSGGALINLDGQVVGLSVGGFGAHEGFQGIGLAVPINVANRIARQLIDVGYIRRASLGCDVEDLSSEVAEHLGVTDRRGLIVTNVKPQSSAAKGGLRPGDVVTHFNHKPVHNNLAFLRFIEQAAPGIEITLTALRERRRIELKITPEEMTEQQTQSGPAGQTKKPELGYYDDRFGVTLDVPSPEWADRYGYSAPIDGLIITHVDSQSPVAKQDVCAGMLLLQVNGQPVRNLKQYRQASTVNSADQRLLALIGTPGRQHFIVLQQPHTPTTQPQPSNRSQR